jgi:hypothetical protein
MDIRQLQANRENFPSEELAKYAGKHVAWSPDGTKIAASGDTLDEVLDKLPATPYDPSECLLSYVPKPGEIFLGGMGL